LQKALETALAGFKAELGQAMHALKQELGGQLTALENRVQKTDQG
jgi:hypothetical protein